MPPALVAKIDKGNREGDADLTFGYLLGAVERLVESNGQPQ